MQSHKIKRLSPVLEDKIGKRFKEGVSTDDLCEEFEHSKRQIVCSIINASVRDEEIQDVMRYGRVIGTTKEGLTEEEVELRKSALIETGNIADGARKANITYEQMYHFARKHMDIGNFVNERS